MVLVFVFLTSEWTWPIRSLSAGFLRGWEKRDLGLRGSGDWVVGCGSLVL